MRFSKKFETFHSMSASKGDKLGNEVIFKVKHTKTRKDNF